MSHTLSPSRRLPLREDGSKGRVGHLGRVLINAQPPIGAAGAFRASAEYSKIAQMIDDNAPEIESSPLCESVTRDGITVRVEIYRLAGRGEGWSLEVVDQKGGSTVWDGTFANDQDAHAEFYRTLESEGIRSIAEPLSGRAH